MSRFLAGCSLPSLLRPAEKESRRDAKASSSSAPLGQEFGGRFRAQSFFVGPHVSEHMPGHVNSATHESKCAQVLG